MYSKESHKQDKKTIPRIWENICKQSNQQGINLQNIQTALDSSVSKPNNLIKKMGRRPKQKVLQRRHKDGQQTH